MSIHHNTIHHYTINHRKLIEQYKFCVCTYCLYEYNMDKIKDWCDNNNTAICPYCWVDSVLPSPFMCNLYTVEQVMNDHKGWFQEGNGNGNKEIVYTVKETYSMDQYIDK
jgi:hypothetical protein